MGDDGLRGLLHFQTNPFDPICNIPCIYILYIIYYILYVYIVELRTPAMPVGVGGGKERGGFHLNLRT